ncbi:MAG: methylenetetrahydrofolate reductase [NAD(P)H] [Gammaproteobacteria bacterium]|nr:methylenetetrahydrofolate reductase [NAD(P)H] [Gammaproteobacteria bacterium]MDH5594802.1 methylenetetrahydrofolate reductase [NAD(P)H] [Gammaproteobacteria bacterium]MDH5613774.1 methylenetetrahydrofolate reductase [NAD(P)H] [Gammaproteobacteria bacterium]
MDSQKKYPKTFSFEFFPPKTAEGAEKLRNVRDELGKLNPKYFSVTFGAGGSTQQGTYETVTEIQQAGYEAAPHLSCIGSTRERVSEILQSYLNEGISHIVALRGDMPSGMGEAGEFRYANELVEFIREQTGDQFFIEVAAYPEFHPQAMSAEVDLQNFARKVKAGANSALTQYFYNPDAYFRFVDDCEKLGIDIPIIPGIMPITNYKSLARFSEMCGAEIPRWIRKRLESYGDDIESLRDFGMDVTVDMCQKLLDAGTPGLHFYTMNQTGPTMTVWKRLGL